MIYRPEIFLLAYKILKGNRGALTKIALVDKHTF